MRLFIFALAVIVCAAGCKTTPSGLSETRIPTVSIAPSPTPLQGETTVDFTREGLDISLPKPAGWQSFNTEYGVVIAERFGSVADSGTLQGLMAYVFVIPFSEFAPQPPDSTVNHAHHILAQIAHDKAFIGNAHASEPTGFDWDGHAAAYYLLSEPDNSAQTVVIGVSLPDKQVLLVGTLSAPVEEIDAMHSALYDLFGGLTVNGVGMNEQALDALPDPLIFP